MSLQRETLLGMVLITPLMFAGSASAAAITLDLHAAGHGASVTDGVAWFQDTHEDHPSAATFLTLNSNNAVIQGYNNDAGAHEFADVQESQTDPLTLNQLPSAFGYRVFLFDGNQLQSGDSYDHIALLDLEIYTATSGSINSLATLRSTGSLVYKMDDGSIANDYTVLIEGRVGTGKADMHLFIPENLFTLQGASEADTFVYLYSRFDNNNDGNEHWNYDLEFTYTDPTIPVPVAPTALLGLLGLGLLTRARRMQLPA